MPALVLRQPSLRNAHHGSERGTRARIARLILEHGPASAASYYAARAVPLAAAGLALATTRVLPVIPEECRLRHPWQAGLVTIERIQRDCPLAGAAQRM